LDGSVLLRPRKREEKGKGDSFIFRRGRKRKRATMTEGRRMKLEDFFSLTAAREEKERGISNLPIRQEGEKNWER